MNVFFQKAERKQAKLRLALSGPTGSGKTESALKLAAGIGGRIAVVDTEDSSASLYADRYDFFAANLTPPYTPEKFINAIKAAEQGGFDILIMDSITHEWSGTGGCLEIVDTLTKGKFKGNSWGAWSEVTPRHRKFIDAILHSSIHIIVTLRSKMETQQVTDANGKKKVEKVGMKSEQRDGIEYEFTTVLDLNADHYAVATKDRTHIFSEPMVITEATGTSLKDWLLSGSADATIDGNQHLELETLMIQAGIDIEKFCQKRKLNSLLDVKQQVFDETCDGIKKIIERTKLTQNENEQQLKDQQEKTLENEYQLALKHIESAQSFNDLDYPANYFKGTKFEQNIINACTAKKDMEGWSA
ncbi:ATP-binding protein [Acinetobacter sp. WU_MDCI_Abxa265]|uniref:ATP-binding protein n=1 Tax=Acinetobacter sp. WU_MDCI_Abxa265 TaxID=2850077 RepID=UPI0021CD8782|nr:ATP-binding protein [Acinetobacter sp. WU_MDCI_Abxa265]MCU4634899.1 ATP-binding protein [Acinetobacter sp. WU_MDCI_Abxa265]